MGVFKYINFPIFICSLLFGIFAVYIMMPDERKIYVYPTPDNIGLLQYRDKTGTCFSFKEMDVQCPMLESQIAKIPMQS
jgi:hypothetical protein